MASLSTRFWAKAAKSPDEALKWFELEDCWQVFGEAEAARKACSHGTASCVGPFKLTVPELGGRTVYVLGVLDQSGDDSQVEESQKRFLARFSAQDLTGTGQKIRLFLERAGKEPYRLLVQEHLRRASRAGLQTAALETASLLPQPLGDLFADYIDAANARFAYDRHFWETADCERAFREIIATAIEFYGPKSPLRQIEDALLPEHDELVFNLFQVITLNFAYSASFDRRQRKFMGIRKGLFG